MELTIAPRFNGPPDSGHGGYVAGRVAALIGRSARVRLHRPPPLGRALAVRREADTVMLLDGEAVVASGRPAAVEMIVPAAVGFGEAEAATRAYPGFRDHLFARCFACGPARAVGDGLRIFPGPVPGRDVVAAPWIPDPALADDEGVVAVEFLWSALDCPSGWASIALAGGAPSVLGELTARIVAPVRAGERCVVLGWVVGGEGRKSFTGAALVGDDGGPRAVAQATWIALARS
jgi:hypothetical protein